MAMSYQRAADHVRHTLGGELSSEMSLIDIMNDAGDYMANMYPWRWLEEKSEALVMTDTVNSIALPSGFVELLGYSPRGSDGRMSATKVAYHLVSPKELFDLREAYPGSADPVNQYTAVPAYRFYVAVCYGVESNVPTPKMEIFPTPHASDGNATGHKIDSTAEFSDLTIRYRAGWSPITGDTSSFVMPVWCESLYSQLLRGFARGYEEEDVGSLNLRLAEVANGPVYQFAVQRDALVESSTIRSVRRRSPDAIAGLAGSILSAQGQQGQ